MEDVGVVVAAAPPPPPSTPMLPPGFRFQPTDEELITHYLVKKVADASFLSVAVGEVELNKCEPWDLPLRAKMGEKEWYFFCVRDLKYPTGLRTNRATKAGYWKATGKDSAIYRGKSLVGMKKTLVFYRGRAPNGEKSNWVMHEYRLEGKYYSLYSLPPRIAKNEWVVCRVFHKIPAGDMIEKPIKAEVSLPPPPPAPPKRPEPASTFDAAYVTCFSSATVPPAGTFDEHLHDGADYFRSPAGAAAFLPAPPAPEPPLRHPLLLSMMSSLLQPPAPATAELASPAVAEAATSAGHILLLDQCLWNC